MFATIGLSMLDRHFEVSSDAFMLRFWYCFALGTMAYWASARRVAPATFTFAVCAVAMYGLSSRDLYAWTAVLAATTIYLTVRMGKQSLGSWAPLQFLGRISYSLYLTHLLGGWLALSLAAKFMPGWAAFTVGTVVALLSAWLFYAMIEAPAVRWSRKIPQHAGIPAQRAR
jgi:peptidoglycan/LPS O-acetylase OafA/YrhL